MKFQRITNSNDKLLNEIYAIYEYSFPQIERRDKVDFYRVLADERFYLNAILNEKGELLGFLNFWKFSNNLGEYLFAEHFAIDKNLRGTGIGKDCVNYLKSLNLPILCEIEPPITEISIKREKFYQSLGFVNNLHFHLQPPFRKTDKELELIIMSFPCEFTEEEYLSFKQSQLDIS